MGRKKITFELSEDSIDRAIRELEQYKQDFLRKVDLFREKVAERLASEAESGFSGAIVDDIFKRSGGVRYASVDVSVDNRGAVTVVIAKGEDAVWVEFGAGVYHNTSPGTSPHPSGAELGFTIGDYGNGNGKRNTWGFYEDGQLRVTRGTPAKMPMYHAMRTVCNELSEIAKEVFS